MAVPGHLFRGAIPAIPASAGALIFDNSRYYVLVYHGAGKADITPVDRLNTLGGKVYLKSGVTAGEKVVASSALQIYDQLNN